MLKIKRFHLCGLCTILALSMGCRIVEAGQKPTMANAYSQTWLDGSDIPTDDGNGGFPTKIIDVPTGQNSLSQAVTISSNNTQPINPYLSLFITYGYPTLNLNGLL